jgi:WD40 repeat protein
MWIDRREEGMTDAASTRDDSGPLVARVFGDFVLRELVGAGGFGHVYLAEQQTLRREAIVKVLRADETRDGHGVEGFLREAKLASQLDHPYAAHVYAFGAEPDGVCWIAMERVRGSSLRALLEAQGPMPLERFVPLLERICEVVHTAHEQGITHRDLKPDNVMVISRAGRLLPKLLDFGIAHAMSETRPSTKTGIRGSLQYLAPELWIEPHGGGPAVDQYALGALAYEALTGQFAFPGRTMFEIARAHARPARRPLGEGLPAALEAVIDRALARRAADRYSNVLELAQAFRDASGVGRTALEIPHLDEELRLRLLTHAPQPIADAIAAYGGVKNAHQAREALRALARIVGWYVGLLALACRTRVGSGMARDAESTRALITDLRRHGLTPAGWTALARQLTRPFVAAPDTYPIPELVLLLHPTTGADPLAAIVEGSLAESLPDTSEDAAAQAIARELPQVTALLRAATFLLDYLLVVTRDTHGEAWMGTRGTRRIVPRVRDLPAGRVVLTDGGGVPLLVLWPLLQVAVAVPGHGEQMFLLSGPGRQGAKLLSAPHGFAHHDHAVWEWFRTELFERSEEESSIARGNPYRGLLPYRARDAAWFFGREQESEVVVNRLRIEPFVAIVGPSGVGKSSLVHAGVAPALEWQVVSMRPGRAPLAQLAAQLTNRKIDLGDLAEGDLGTIVDRLRRAAAEAGGLLIVVDQFEELLTLGCPPDERDRFIRVLLAMASAVDAALGIVITLRDDFLIRVEQLPGLAPVLARGIQLLGPLGPEALERIIVEPARRFGYEFEDPALPARMVETVAGAPGATALISFAVTRLWELRDRHFHQLSTKAYAAIGGVTGALARHADETVDAMPASERQLVRKAFRHLVTFEDTRAVLEREELRQLLGGGDDAERLIGRLIDARLLVSSENDRGTGVVEIVHEALIREWPRLVEWRREDTEGSRFHEQLRAAARQWQDRGRPRGLLWRGDALAEYQLWRRRHAPSLTPAEAAFGAASTADAARGRRVRQVIAAAAVAVVAVFFVALWRANLAANRAKLEAEVLLRDSYFEQGRLRVLEGDRLGALAPLATAYRMGSTGTATRLLLDEAARPTRARVRTLAGHTDKLWDVAYSPDGQWIATTSTDHTARVWDAETGALRATLQHTDWVFTVAFSRDSRLVASGGSDHTVRVWDVSAGREIVALPVSAATRQVAFSPDGSTLLTASGSNAVKLWRIPSGTPAGELADHRQLVGATFCEDGACIVTWDAARIAVWDATTLAPRASYTQEGVIRAAAVSRSHALLAIGTMAGELTLLRGDGSVIARRAAHNHAILDLAISPDAAIVATASSDGTVRLWSATGEPRGTLAGHRANVSAVRFTPAGDRIVTASTDSTARLWTVSGMLLGELTGHTNSILKASVRHDGARAATASWDKTAIVWDLSRAQEYLPIANPRGFAPRIAAFDPAGRRIAVAAEGGALAIADASTGVIGCTAPGTPGIAQLAWIGEHELAVLRRGAQVVELWDLRRCAAPRSLPHPAPITVMSVRPGPRVATVAGNVVRVFRGGQLEATFTGYAGIIENVGLDGDDVYATTETPAELVVDAIGEPARRRTFRAGTKGFADVRFDREHGRIVAASLDQFLYVWNTTTGALETKLEGTGPLWGVRASPDGALAIGVGGVSPTVWDRANGARLRQLEGHSDLVRDGAFLGDRLFLSLAWNGTAIVWDVDSGRALTRFHEVDELAFSEARRAVALVGATGVRIWSPDAPVPDLDALRAHAPGSR